MESFVRQLDDLRSFKLGKFEIVLDDPSGDSFIENPHEPHKDPNMSVVFYKRNKDQNEMLGIEVTKSIPILDIESNVISDNLILGGHFSRGRASCSR